MVLVPRLHRYLCQLSPFAKLCWLFFLAALLLYGSGISNFAQPYFDEITHVPAARELLQEGVNPILWHPPLNNRFIVLSMQLFGDNPWGWRGLSILAGALLLLGLLHICAACRFSHRRIIYVGCLALCSHFIYIHARIAKPDIFFCALLVWALALLLKAYTTNGRGRKITLLALSALLWGLASSVKWLALVGLVLCCGHFLLLKLLRRKFTSAGNVLTWHDMALLGNLALWQVLGVYLLAYLGGYLLPYLLERDFNFINDLKTIWELQHAIHTKHPYQSAAWQWPLMLRPIWYAYDDLGDGLTRAVFCVGNPYILLMGLLSLPWSIYHWYRHGSLLACMNVIFYAGFYGFWLITSRAAAFHYYYFPATLFLLLSLGECGSNLLTRRQVWAWSIVIIAAIFFVCYLPILSGVAFPVKRWLYLWMFLRNWI